MALNRKLKMGMVGGGPGAFIGEVHRAEQLAFSDCQRFSQRGLPRNLRKAYGTQRQIVQDHGKGRL